MKNSKRILMTTLLAVPVIFAVGVSAQEPSTAPTPPAEDKAAMQQRLEKRKAELNIKQVTNGEKLRIQQKCKASQGNISSIKGRIHGVETSRENVHNSLTERLIKLSARLKEAGADTTALQAELDTLNTKIELFKTDLALLKSAVSDLAGMDCAADPAAFKASLEAARAARTKVKADTVDVKKYVNETIKPTLKDLRTQLEGLKTNGGDQ